jgi:hypothetical protein
MTAGWEYLTLSGPGPHAYRTDDRHWEGGMAAYRALTGEGGEPRETIGTAGAYLISCQRSRIQSQPAAA